MSTILFLRYGEGSSLFIIRDYRKGKKIARKGTHSASTLMIKMGSVEVCQKDAGVNKKVFAEL